MNRFASLFTGLSLVIALLILPGCLKRSMANQETATVAEVIETAQVVPADELSPSKF